MADGCANKHAVLRCTADFQESKALKCMIIISINNISISISNSGTTDGHGRAEGRQSEASDAFKGDVQGEPAPQHHVGVPCQPLHRCPTPYPHPTKSLLKQHTPDLPYPGIQ